MIGCNETSAVTQFLEETQLSVCRLQESTTLNVLGCIACMKVQTFTFYENNKTNRDGACRYYIKFKLTKDYHNIVQLLIAIIGL